MKGMGVFFFFVVLMLFLVSFYLYDNADAQPTYEPCPELTCPPGHTKAGCSCVKEGIMETPDPASKTPDRESKTPESPPEKPDS
jgi:hypothetical protein